MTGAREFVSVCAQVIWPATSLRSCGCWHCPETLRVAGIRRRGRAPRAGRQAGGRGSRQLRAAAQHCPAGAPSQLLPERLSPGSRPAPASLGPHGLRGGEHRCGAGRPARVPLDARGPPALFPPGLPGARSPSVPRRRPPPPPPALLPGLTQQQQEQRPPGAGGRHGATQPRPEDGGCAGGEAGGRARPPTREAQQLRRRHREDPAAGSACHVSRAAPAGHVSRGSRESRGPPLTPRFSRRPHSTPDAVTCWAASRGLQPT